MSTENETVFLQGFIFKRPHENAPAFVKGSMSIKVDEAIAFLQQHNNNGWVNADLLASKDNSKLYFKLNTYKPETSQNAPQAPTPTVNAGEDTRQAPQYPEEEINPEDIPFN